MADVRDMVLWFGASLREDIVREYANRSLRLEQVDAAESTPPASVRAAVFAFGADAGDQLVKQAQSSIERYLNYGIRIDIMAADDNGLGRVQNALGAILSLPGVGVATAPDPHILAERAARHNSGPQPRLDLEIVVDDNREPIREADKPLFQRAFSHCSRIVLVELTGGRSDARVFAVYMTVDTSNAGIWPQPAFAKLDRREKIEREHYNYREFAERFIPFGLRPNVDDVIDGVNRSLLVGDFVDRSESLWDLARRNVASQAITSLIEETLGGWRDQAYADAPKDGAVAQAMINADMCKPDQMSSRYPESAKDQGVKAEPCQLWDTLLSLRQTYREAPAHGDLHGENVRVRNGQAILIDLSSVAKGPLTADLAALETWFAFQLPPECDENAYEDGDWSAEIDRLYAPPAFQHPPGPCDATSKMCWMTTIVRQLRKMGIAAQSCPTEYQSAVAVHLLRRCQWDDVPAADRFRRTKAYIVAARLVQDLSRNSE